MEPTKEELKTLGEKMFDDMKRNAKYSKEICEKHKTKKFHDETLGGKKFLACWDCIDESIEKQGYN